VHAGAFLYMEPNKEQIKAIAAEIRRLGTIGAVAVAYFGYGEEQLLSGAVCVLWWLLCLWCSHRILRKVD